MVVPVRRQRGELASVGTDPYNANGVFLTGRAILDRNDQLLITQGGGGPRAIELYNDLLLDPVVLGAFEKITTEIVQRELVVESATNSREDIYVAEFVQRCFDQIGLVNHNVNGELTLPFTPGFNSVTKGLLEAYITGLSAGEIKWVKGERAIYPAQIQIRDSRRFQIMLQENDVVQPRVLSIDSPVEGDPIPARQMIVFRYWGTQNQTDPYGAGIGRQLYYLVQFRRSALSNWMSYSDRYTVPTGLARYPLGVPEEDIIDLQNMMERIGYETSATIPLEFEIEWLKADGDPEVYEKLLEYTDKTISNIVSGESIIGEDRGGSRSKDAVADSVRLRKAKAISDALCETLNGTLVKWIVDLNFKPGTKIPKVKRKFPELEVKRNAIEILDVVAKLKDLGYAVSTEWLAKEIDMPISSSSIRNAPLANESEIGSRGIMQTIPPDLSGFDSISGNVSEQPVRADTEIL